MILVGEKINSSRKAIADAIRRRDGDMIGSNARRQADAGADYIDVNAGTFADSESEHLAWLAETVQASVDLPLCIDSPSPSAVSEAMKRHDGKPMINSISLEPERLKGMLEIATSQPCRVIALCMSSAAMPGSVEELVGAGVEIARLLEEAGISRDDIFIDPLVQPVSLDVKKAMLFLDALVELKRRLPGVNTICGLSNISFGLPGRGLVNRTFLSLAMARGLDAAIADPTDKKLMAIMKTTEMLLGRDEYCEKYIEAHQSGLLDVD